MNRTVPTMDPENSMRRLIEAVRGRAAWGRVEVLAGDVATVLGIPISEPEGVGGVARIGRPRGA